MNTLIIGSGTIGSFIGSQLMQAGAGVTFLVSPQRANDLDRHGLTVHSPKGVFRARVNTKLYHQLSGSYDVLVLATRAHNASITTLTARAALGPNTIVVPLNFDMMEIGTLMEDRPEINLVGAVPQIRLSRAYDGTVRYFDGLAKMKIGALNTNAIQSVATIAELFSATEIVTPISTKIRETIWSWFAFSAACSAFKAMHPEKYTGKFRTSHDASVFSDMLKEGQKVGRSLGMQVDFEYLAWSRDLEARLPMLRAPATRSADTLEANHNLMVMVRHAQDVKQPVPLFTLAYETIHGLGTEAA